MGTDVALEALAASWREQRVTMDALWEAAKADRVTTVMRSYLEAVQV